MLNFVVMFTREIPTPNFSTFIILLETLNIYIFIFKNILGFKNI